MLKIFLVVLTTANTAPSFTEIPSLKACWQQAEATVATHRVMGAGCAVVPQ